MRFITSVLLLALFAFLGVSANIHDAERRKIIEAVNSNPNATWTAGLNQRFAGKPWAAVKRQLGALNLNVPSSQKLPLKIHTGFDVADIPASFDSRKQWPNCKSIQEIRDQSDCGSCWAFGAVEAGSDRICIETGNNVHLSAEDLLSCCSSCGFGCNGGDPGSAWSYFTQTGVVTGGNYGDYSLCSAYSLPNCEHHTTKTRYPSCSSFPGEFNTPSCPTACDANSTYTVPYAQDKHIFASSYSVGSDATQIQQEIMTNGPVEAAFTVYADFESYTGGVYQYTTGAELGGHAVKILGWGVDAQSNLPYWLVANSWNNDWGENGFFRIERGVDMCGIEDNIVAGLYTQAKHLEQTKKAQKQQKKHNKKHNKRK